MELRQKIDKEASDHLGRWVGRMPDIWGGAEKTAFPGTYRFKDWGGAAGLELTYEAKKQLLGGVFSQVYTLRTEGSALGGQEETKLHYHGWFLKGDAFFKQKGQGAAAELLNRDAELIRLLSALDLLSLSLIFREGSAEIRLSPLGGAFTYTLFPPVKYGADLPGTDLERIRRALIRMEILISGGEQRSIAGAEA